MQFVPLFLIAAAVAMHQGTPSGAPWPLPHVPMPPGFPGGAHWGQPLQQVAPTVVSPLAFPITLPPQLFTAGVGAQQYPLYPPIFVPPFYGR